jgi:hypothetical protein
LSVPAAKARHSDLANAATQAAANAQSRDYLAIGSFEDLSVNNRVLGVLVAGVVPLFLVLWHGAAEKDAMAFKWYITRVMAPCQGLGA